MIAIFLKEIRGFLNSLIAYVVVGVFLTAIGLLMWVFPETSVLDYGYADMDSLFSFAPYVLMFLIPSITMRTFAEEKKLGTMELLLTKPITDGSILIGKFLATFALVVFSLLPTLIYYVAIYRLGTPAGNIDSSAVAGSYFGLLLLGAVFCTIGVFTSSLTSNQILAFISASFLCFLFYSGFESFSSIGEFAGQSLVIKQLGLLYHYESMSRGLIDSRDLVYFFSAGGIFLLLTRTTLSARSW